MAILAAAVLRAQEPTLDDVLARAAVYVSRYQTAAAGPRRRGDLSPERHVDGSGPEHRPRGPRAAVARGPRVEVGSAARQARRRELLDAVPRCFRSGPQTGARPRSAALQVVRRSESRRARAGGHHPAGKRALQPRPDHAHDQRADHGAAVSRAQRPADRHVRAGQGRQRQALRGSGRCRRHLDDRIPRDPEGHDGQRRQQPGHPVTRAHAGSTAPTAACCRPN